MLTLMARARAAEEQEQSWPFLVAWFGGLVGMLLMIFGGFLDRRLPYVGPPLIGVVAVPLAAQLIARQCPPQRRATTAVAVVLFIAGFEAVTLGGIVSAALVFACAGFSAIAVGCTLVNADAPRTLSGWPRLLARGVPLAVVCVGGTLVTVALVNPDLGDVRLYAGVAIVAVGCGLIAMNLAGSGAMLEAWVAHVIEGGRTDDENADPAFDAAWERAAAKAPKTRGAIAAKFLTGALLAIAGKFALHVLKTLSPF